MRIPNIGLRLHRLFYFSLQRRAVSTVRLGNPCAWTFCANYLNDKSVIVCAGAGGDISFEIALHQMTGATVLLLDPSPTGAKTLDETLPAARKGIRFLPYGLASASGTLQFAVPADSREGSYALDEGQRETVSFECRSLKDLMLELGVQQIDLLKMDIEGFEWQVLRSIFRERLPVSQICVEFHPTSSKLVSRFRRYAILFELMMRGYDLIDHQGIGDHTFLRRRR